MISSLKTIGPYRPNSVHPTLSPSQPTLHTQNLVVEPSPPPDETSASEMSFENLCLSTPAGGSINMDEEAVVPEEPF